MQHLHFNNEFEQLKREELKICTSMQYFLSPPVKTILYTLRFTLDASFTVSSPFIPLYIFSFPLCLCCSGAVLISYTVQSERVLNAGLVGQISGRKNYHSGMDTKQAPFPIIQYYLDYRSVYIAFHCERKPLLSNCLQFTEAQRKLFFSDLGAHEPGLFRQQMLT